MRYEHLMLATLAAIFTFSGAASASQSETTIYQFRPDTGDGYAPVAGLIADAKSNLYGTTMFGGAACGSNGCGTVFELSPVNGGRTWTETILYSFQGAPDGAYPGGALVFDKQGNLYGTTAGGGASRAGTIFQLAPPSQQGGSWTETVLYNFTGFNDGYFPVTLAIDASGNLYGVEPGYPTGFGSVFELSSPGTTGGAWTFTVLYNFRGGAQHDGTRPVGGLVLSPWGVIYGVTAAGGSGTGCNADGCGTVFQLAPQKNGSWTERVVYMFSGGSDGGIPVGLVLERPTHTLYGAAAYGGNSAGGTIFQLASQHGSGWSETTIFSFDQKSLFLPESGPVVDAKGNLYGTTYMSSNSGGGVYQLAPQQGGAWTETTLYEFSGGADGGVCPAGLMLSGTKQSVYGTTETGGLPSNGGVVFKIVLP